MGSLERQGDTFLKQMKNGTEFIKVSCGKRRTSVKKRIFQVTENEMYLQYSPSSKEMKDLQVEIEDIQEVRAGRNTDRFRDMTKYRDDHSFSIIVNGETRILNLVAPNKDLANLWIKGLRLMMKKSERIDVRMKQAIWIKDMFMKADKNGNGTLDSKEVLKLVEEMNVKIDKDYAMEIFQRADVKRTRQNALDEDEFVTFYREITGRTEIQELFKSYAGDDDFLTPDEFQQFMHREQKRPEVDKAWCIKMIEKFEPKEELCQKKMMTIDGFQLFLLSEDGLILHPKNNAIYQDMTQPLSHYFISSSHNTYLLEDQLKGPSSTEAYISALRKGCRCVELDVWDGSDDEPVIYHGHTLTSKILLKDALEAICDYAFTTSDYPLILSFENHCSIEQQRRMAEIIESTIGDFLYRLTRPEDIHNLPSPEELKHKILVKGKKLPPFASAVQGGDVSDEDEAADMEDVDDEEVKKQLQESKDKKAKTIKLAKEFSDTVYLSSRHFKGVDEEMRTRKPFEMSSFTESKALDLAKKNGTAFAWYNSRFLSRMYPAGWRTNSSNYNPIPMWNVGAQIVALNFQTDGDEMDIYRGRFLENGNCGYVLKPDFMLKNAAKRDNTKRLNPILLRVVVISGQQLPKQTKDIDDPYVKVTMYGANITVEHKTDVVKKNGFNPMWKCKMEFDVQIPELSMVRFEVRDRDISSRDDFIAQYSLPVACMQEGYHHIPLLTEEGNDISSSTLFVHVAKVEKKMRASDVDYSKELL